MGNQYDRALLEVYESWSVELKSRYKRISKLFKHGPTIGRSREIYLTEMLNRCLPNGLRLVHGAFYSPSHGASRQQDIMVVSASDFAPIEEIGDYGIYYRECVRACIEVKSRLDKNELNSALRLLAESRAMGPGGNCSFILFAYMTNMTAEQILHEIDNTELFFDNRPSLIVVLGQFVISVTELLVKRPCPEFTLTVFEPREGGLDLTLLELMESIMEIDRVTPLRSMQNEICGHFRPVARKVFKCPVNRPGEGIGTNIF